MAIEKKYSSGQVGGLHIDGVFLWKWPKNINRKSGNSAKT
jgi:hypothetical protein